MLIQLTYADDVLVSQSPFLRLAEPLSLKLLVCEHPQSVLHSVLVFQMLSSLLLVQRSRRRFRRCSCVSIALLEAARARRSCRRF